MQELEAVRRRLEAAHIENADMEARMLCEAFHDVALVKAVARRSAHEPLQYILGEWGFWRETYEVNEHCLVPRPDTEHLVEKAIEFLPKGASFLDLCTGSGCVAISALASRPDTRALAVDLFPETLALAARNAARNGVEDRVTFRQADVLLPPFATGSFDAILSNPPYIRTEVIETLSPEVRREPAAALDGGADGLAFYRAILGSWKRLLAKEGFFLLEIGYDQADAVTALAQKEGFSTTVYRDYGGNDRVVLAKRRV